MRAGAAAGTVLGMVIFIAGMAEAAPEENPGARLIRENNCIACHRIGADQLPRNVPKVGPDFSHTGHRLNPGWLMDYLRNPKKLRPANPARMPNFRLTNGEASALTAYLMTRKESWPKPPGGEKGEEETTTFPKLFGRLPAGDAGRGRKLFEAYECAKCHGDPARPGASFEGKPEERGPDLREVARKLTRMGVASMLFQPGLIHRDTKMPAFFYDQGEAMDEEAPRQMADVAAFIRSLAGSVPKVFAGGDAAAGRKIAAQLNCSGCHEGLDVPARPQEQVARSLGYRNAPQPITRAIVTSWLRKPETISMHERMHGMGRMPTFGFTPLEADRIVHYLFTVEGPPRGGGGMMMERGMGSAMRRMRGWISRIWEWLRG